jgi:hypothetical protein
MPCRWGDSTFKVRTLTPVLAIPPSQLKNKLESQEKLAAPCIAFPFACFSLLLTLKAYGEINEVCITSLKM